MTLKIQKFADGSILAFDESAREFYSIEIKPLAAESLTYGQKIIAFDMLFGGNECETISATAFEE